MVCHLLGVGTGQVDSTSHGGQLGEVNGQQVIVVRDSKTTADGFEQGQGNAVEIGVGFDVQIGASGQVGSREVGNVVSEQTQFTSEVDQRWNRDSTGVTEGHVRGRSEVGEHDLELVAVGRDCQSTSDVLDVVHVDRGQSSVGGQVEVTNGLELDTLQRSQPSVGDADTAGIVNACGEGEGLQVGQSLEDDRANRGEFGERERGQQNDVLQVEVIGNGGEIRSRDRRKVGHTVGDQATREGLNAIECKIIGDRGVNVDIALNSRAGGEGIGIRLRGNVGGRARSTAVA